METLIFDNRTNKFKLCSARRIGKTYKIMARMLYDLLHLPWYNGACIRKYQGQVQENLLKPLYNLVYVFQQYGIISKQDMNRVYKTQKEISYDNRSIFFFSLENPNNTLNFQPRGGTKTQPSLCQTILIDEIIQAQDKYQLDVDAMKANLLTIKSSLNRGIRAPYGADLQEYWTLNPWDWNNEIYQVEIEKNIPVGTQYISEEKIEEVKKNHKELLTGSGEIIHKDEKGNITYRASDLIIPETRYNDKMKEERDEAKENDVNSFLCIYKGIHANIFNNKFTYISNMPTKPIFYDPKKHGQLQHIEIGLDRGLRDDTVFFNSSYSKNENGDYFIVINDIKWFNSKNKETKLSYVFQNLNFLNNWYDEIKPKRKINIVADYSAKEFNNYLKDYLLNDKELKSKYKVIKCLKDKKNKWDIKNRQDFLNQLLAMNKVLFNPKMKLENIERFWYELQNCVNDENGKRNEKPGINKLDALNAGEYSWSYWKRDKFNK